MSSETVDACGPTLSALRDLEGVIGSFVLTRAGELCSVDHLGQLAREGLHDTGSRIARLVETVTLEGSFNSCWVRFVQHRLLLRPLNDTHLLGVLTAENVNQPALRMATTLVLRKLAPMAIQPLLDTAAAPVATESQPKSGAQRVAPTQATRTERIYRGHRITRD